MFTPFTREDNVLNQQPFLDYEVQFNLFHRVMDGKELMALKTQDNRAIAMQNPGFVMWLWMHDELDQGSVETLINALCHQLKEAKLPSIAAKPEIAQAFAAEYAKLHGISYKTSMGMTSYHCPQLIEPQSIEGRLIKAQLEHTDLVAEYMAGFLKWGFGKTVTKESQIQSAENLINSGNFYLWVVGEQVVSTTNIAHRSPRHGRINQVYTPPEFRKRGYASALVAEVCKIIFSEGLTPMLYADLLNPTSNKIYQDMGFQECGKIEQISFIY